MNQNLSNPPVSVEPMHHTNTLSYAYTLSSHLAIQPDIDRISPLMYAAHKGSVSCAQALVEAGADLCASDLWGRSVLHFAVVNGVCCVRPC